MGMAVSNVKTVQCIISLKFMNYKLN